jgi:hypothetical protein
MGDYLDQIDQLLSEAGALPPGAAKLALVERAVQLADTHRDPTQGFRTRVELCGEALDAGRPDLLTTAFSWCLGQSDRDPRKFPDLELLWMYRWVNDEISGFSSVSLQQIQELMADMERRYRQIGSTMRGYEYLRRNVAMNCGDRTGADDADRAIAACRRDWLSDSEAAERCFDVRYLVFAKRYEEAVRKAEPLLAGRTTDDHHRGAALARLMIPLLRLGRADEAVKFHLQGYRLVARNSRYVARFANHITLLALTGNFARALALLERHLSDALESVDDDSHFSFFRACRVLMEQLVSRGRDSLRLRLPAIFPLVNAEGRYETAALRDWFVNQATEIAARFDARNGNSHYLTELAATEELHAFAVNVPLR